MSLDRIEDALAAVARGEIVVVLDDDRRENEGDLVMAAEHANEERMAFFVRHTSGLVCTAITNRRADELDLPLMVTRNSESQRTAFTVTVDLRHGTSTGISAGDRSATARALVDPATAPADLARPGHMHVLRARDGGVLERAGHTEAAVDLARLAGLQPAGVLCEVVTADGRGMARRAELERFATRHRLRMITVADLIRYRLRRSSAVEMVGTCRSGGSDFEMHPEGCPVPVISANQEARVIRVAGADANGSDPFSVHVYQSTADGGRHVAFVMGDVEGRSGVLVRVHSECFTGDELGSSRCDCGTQLESALALIAHEGAGVVVYLRGQEGRGIGLANKLLAYNLQDDGADTVDANLHLGLPVDSRGYQTGAAILADLGVTSIRLLTNNPAKRRGLERAGLDVASLVRMRSVVTPDNVCYLRTKQRRLGHLLQGLR